MDDPRQTNCSIENIYTLDGRVPLLKAIPFGVQHILAMFVANLAPIAIIAHTIGLPSGDLAMLIQNAMFAAGIGTLIQLYPVWKVGSGLPVVMGVSFTFVSILCSVGTASGYPTIVGCVLVGGLLEGTFGLLAKYWRRIISPIVASTVVTAIGLSLFTVGTRSFGGGYNDDFGSPSNLLLGTITLVTCLVWTSKAKGHIRQLSVLAGLIVGYITAIFMGKVDLSGIMAADLFALPRLLPYKPVFDPAAIFSVAIIYLVSAAETIGDVSALAITGCKRFVKEDELRGALACDGYSSFISGLFGTCPLTSFSQNVGLIAMTKVVNRFTIATGAMLMILAGVLPPLGALFASLPDSVLGGCTIMMFGQIVTAGIQMITECGFSHRNVTIISLSLAMGIGFTATTEQGLWNAFPPLMRDVFGSNVVAIVFVVAILLDLFLPKDFKP